PNVLVVEITTFDNALTRPWTAIKKYRRGQNQRPVWRESVCAENNAHVEIAGQGYMLSADGFLMPAKKDQAPPDLRYFEPKQNYRGGMSMLNRSAVLGLAIAAVMSATQSGVFAFDPATYPNLKGQWFGVRGTAGGGQPSFDPVKRWGTTQDA